MDDLSALERIELITIGIYSYNIKKDVPNDIHSSNLFISPQNLKSQDYLDQIPNWKKDQQMKLNNEKTNYMILNSSSLNKLRELTRVQKNAVNLILGRKK